MSSDKALNDAIRNLGEIAKSILSENDNLIIPASTTTISGDLMVNNHTTISGDLMVNGKIITNNNYKTILLSCALEIGYYGPILDKDGFSIPLDKYWCRPPIAISNVEQADVNGIPISGAMIPGLIENTDTNEWWTFYYFNFGPMREGDIIIANSIIFLYEFIPRSTFLPNAYLPIRLPIPIPSSSTNYTNLTRIRVMTKPTSYDYETLNASLITVTQNTSGINPYQ